jgi:hypothetical protein
MENFDQIFTLLAEEGIGLNLDILETGLIFCVSCNFSLYWSRFFRICIRRTKNNDCKGVQDAEDFMKLKTFKRSRKQLNQAMSLLVKLK